MKVKVVVDYDDQLEEAAEKFVRALRKLGISVKDRSPADEPRQVFEIEVKDNE